MCKARCWREYEGGTVWDTDCSVSHSFPPDPSEAFPRNLPERREKIKFTSLRSLLSFFGSFLSILCSSTPEEEKWKGLFQVSDSRAVVTRQLEIPSQFFFFLCLFSSFLSHLWSVRTARNSHPLVESPAGSRPFQIRLSDKLPAWGGTTADRILQTVHPRRPLTACQNLYYSIWHTERERAP